MLQRIEIHEIDGEWSQYPQTKTEAMERNVVKYHPVPTPVCPRCGHKAPRYTRTDICAVCARIDASDTFQAAISGDLPATATEAIAAGSDHYWRPDPGKNCGHIGMTTIDGKCKICQDLKESAPLSPRQQAIKDGEAWYMPEEPCRTCGQIARKRVANGSCEQCEENKKAPKDAPIWKTCPDIIISKKDAIIFGLSVYRTGEPCRRGHTSWRYVSNGGCLVCMGKIDMTP